MKKIIPFLKRFLKYLFILFILLSIFLVIADQLWFSDYQFPPIHLRIPGLFKTPIPDKTNHALIINGGIHPGKNHARYWNNTSLIYNTLKSISFSDIRVLHTDGLSTGKDRCIRSFMGYVGMGKLEDSPKDLDLNGTTDITGEATKEELEKTLFHLGKDLGVQDKLLIFLTDHGQLRWHKGKLRAVICLWNKEKMFGYELNMILKKSIPGEVRVIIIASQCYGERFLSEIDRPNTILINGGSFLGFMWSNQYYGIFLRNFCSALLQKDIRTGEHLDSDINQDGKVTIIEAFNWAREEDPQPKSPVLKTIGIGSETIFPRNRNY